MEIKGKITVCEVSEGISKSTGNSWKKASYVICYNGHYANGTECKRTLAFNIFGRDRLNQLAIIEGQSGILDFETKGDVKKSTNGNFYETNEVDVISWKCTEQPKKDDPIKAIEQKPPL